MITLESLINLIVEAYAYTTVRIYTRDSNMSIETTAEGALAFLSPQVLNSNVCYISVPEENEVLITLFSIEDEKDE